MKTLYSLSQTAPHYECVWITGSEGRLEDKIQINKK